MQEYGDEDDKVPDWQEVATLVFDAASSYTNMTRIGLATSFEDLIEANRKLETCVYPQGRSLLPQSQSSLILPQDETH